jgi:two-component system phosphate regulon sensor histidine kinase PhoR
VLKTKADHLQPSPGHLILLEALDALSDPVVLVDPRLFVRFANPAARQIWPTLEQGRPLFFAFRLPAIVDAVEQCLRERQSIDVDFAENTPVERFFRLTVKPLQQGSESLERDQPALVLSVRDLSHERRIEHMRVDFIANASHELRTPLASLLGFIETLQGSARHDEKARTRFLDIMRQQAQRMARLIDDLLSLSRVELNEHRVPVTPVDLNPLCESMIETLSPLARERQVVISYEGPNTPSLVAGDADELSRVLENLIENGIKYGQSGGRLEIHLDTLPDPKPMVRLRVRDYGPGIQAKHLPRLTERFYRTDEAESREKGGTGLGLSLVKHILNRHRGRLQIESQYGQGACFTVLLPPTRNS